MIEILPYLFLFGLGLIIGSFLNVIVFRFGFNESRQSRSHCMACNAELRPVDLIPVVSFMFLSGKCRACGSALSIQYPLVELGTAILFALSYTFLPSSFSFAGFFGFVSLLGFLATLVALVAYDMRHTLTPFPFIAALGIFAIAASVSQSFSVGSFAPLTDSAWGTLALSVFFLLLYGITRGRGMGLGDAYVAGAVGALLGLSRGIEAVMFAFWVGTLVMLPLLLLSSIIGRVRRGGAFKRVTMKTELPFVPFLAIGVILALFTDISPLSAGSWLASILWFQNL